VTDRSGWGLLAFLVAGAAATGGLASLAFGIACFADGDRDVSCAVLTVVVPLTTLPLALGVGTLGAAWHGWLTSNPDNTDTAPENALDDPLTPSGNPRNG
jgi:hypothetical protein